MKAIYNLQYSLVQSGESIAIDLLATDQINNSREAVWSLESPDQSTVRNVHILYWSTFCN